MTRREFIAGGAAAFADIAVAADVGRLPRPRLAFQVYAVRDMCEKDLIGTLKAAKELGYEGVETGRFYGRSAAEWKTLCGDVGLELVALQLYPHTLTEPQLRDTIRFCRDIGCRRVNTAWFKGSAENENDWRLVVNVLNHAAGVCAGEGIEIGYHNHDQEVRTRFEGNTALQWLFDRFDPRVKQEFDPGWYALAGEDPCAWLRAHPHRNPMMHVMPAIAESDAVKTRPGEAGVGSAHDRTDWRAVVRQARADGLEWIVVKPTAHPGSLADLAASYGYLADMKELMES